MRLSLATVLIACGSIVAFAQSASHKANASSDLKQSLDRKVPVWLKAYEVPSAAVAFIEHGKLAWIAVYGEQTPGVPATEKTLYNIASLTKPISAEVILRLTSQGKLSLDEPVYSYWTDWDVKDNPWSKLLTARLCLSHQTGFPNWRGQNPDKVLNFKWQPGTNTGYSGEGYNYVARYAENRVGRSFEDLAQQYVLDPISMKDTSYTPRDSWVGRQAKPVESNFRTRWNAADLVRTTVGDYAKFVISVMHNEGVSKEIASERATITRNEVTPEEQTVLCESASIPESCTVVAGIQRRNFPDCNSRRISQLCESRNH